MKKLSFALRAILLSAALSATAANAASMSVKGKVIAMVVQKAAEPEAVESDAKAKAHLEAMGFQVRLIDHLEPAKMADGADLILISATVSSNKMGGKYRHVAKPLLTWEAYMLPHLGMTGRKENIDFGTKERERYLWVVNASHPAAGRLPSGYVNVQQKNVPMGWGKPGLGATILGTFPGEDGKAGAFLYEAGATMDYENIAPARRAFIFVDTAAFRDMNENGLKIFDAVVSWTAQGK